MSKHSHDIELLRQNDCDLRFQYNELLCLRVELARLRSKNIARWQRIKPRNRPAARPVKWDERPASYAPILLLVPERPQT